MIRTTFETREDWLRARGSGIGASESAVALGESKYKTTLELWEEKTGRRQPKDLFENAKVQRGIEQEPKIREAWLSANSWAKVDYHQFDILANEINPFITATLDGEIEVVSADNPYGLEVGDRGILEIKTGGYSVPEDLRRWRDMPQDYFTQVCHQMLACDGDADFAILTAKLVYDGTEADRIRMELASTLDKEFFVSASDEKVKAKQYDIVAACQWFWKHVVDNTRPESFIPNSDDYNPIIPIANAEVGTISSNFPALKRGIEHLVEPYKGRVFDEESIKSAEDDHAYLNKVAKQINDIKISVKKDYMAPYNAFEDQCKELIGIVEAARLPIKEQIDDYERRRREAKRAEIGEAAQEVLNDLDEALSALIGQSGGFDWDEKWLNKGTTMKKVRKDMAEQAQSIKADLDQLEVFCNDDQELYTLLLAEYQRTRNMQAVMAEHRRIIQQREAIKRIAEQHTEKDKPEVISKPTPATTAPPQDTQAAPRVIEYTFWASHTDNKAWIALISYMRENGFTFKKLY